FEDIRVAIFLKNHGLHLRWDQFHLHGCDGGASRLSRSSAGRRESCRRLAQMRSKVARLVKVRHFVYLNWLGSSCWSRRKVASSAYAAKATRNLGKVTDGENFLGRMAGAGDRDMRCGSRTRVSLMLAAISVCVLGARDAGAADKITFVT